MLIGSWYVNEKAEIKIHEEHAFRIDVEYLVTPEY